jgi:hypothetical protein
VALITTAEKALCGILCDDFGLLFRGVMQLKGWLLEDMRMERCLASLQPV